VDATRIRKVNIIIYNSDEVGGVKSIIARFIQVL
jgi:hypothetical protein